MEITQWITQRASLIFRTITLRNTWLKYKETLCYSLELKESTQEGPRWKEIPFPRLGFRSCSRKCSSAHRIAEKCAALPRLCWSAASWRARRSPLECRGGMGNQQLRVWMYRGAEIWWAGGYHAGGRPSEGWFWCGEGHGTVITRPRCRVAKGSHILCEWLGQSSDRFSHPLTLHMWPKLQESRLPPAMSSSALCWENLASCSL